MPDSPFINYSHPSDQADRRNRRTVASYIGTYYRNRSRPSVRKPLRDGPPDGSRPAVVMPIRTGSPSRWSISGAGSVPDSAPQELSLSHRHALLSSRRASPPLAHDGHGLRRDPFNSYPIEFRECIPAAIDFFTQFYGPAHFIRPEVLTPEAGAAILQEYIQYAFQDALTFEAMVALSQANLAVQQWVDSTPDRDTLFHYSMSLQRLREVLDDQSGYTQDSVLFAIVSLMGIDYLLNDIEAFETHLGGLRRILLLRGGLDRVGWPAILKPFIIGIEVFWAYISKHRQQPSTQLIAPVTELDLSCPYHRPGSVDDLGQMIKALRPGFRNIAVQHRLSVPVITLVHRVCTKGRDINQIDRQPHGAAGDSSEELNAMSLQEMEYCVRLLAGGDVTCIERVICIGLLTCIVDCTRTEKFSSLYAQYIRRHAVELRRLQHHFVEAELERFWIWAVLDLVGSMFQRQGALPLDYHADERFHLLMDLIEMYGHMGWEEILAGMKEFFWTPRCIRNWQAAWSFGQAELARR